MDEKVYRHSIMTILPPVTLDAKQARAISRMRDDAMKNAFTKATKWAKENPMTARDTGIAEALLLARKWRNERERLIRAIRKIRFVRDSDIANVKALAERFEKPRTSNYAIGQVP